MSKSTKKLISQRWDQTFSDKVREIALRLNTTSTDLTVESLNFMISLYDSNPGNIEDPIVRSQYLADIIKCQSRGGDRKRYRGMLV